MCKFINRFLLTLLISMSVITSIGVSHTNNDLICEENAVSAEDIDISNSNNAFISGVTGELISKTNQVRVDELDTPIVMSYYDVLELNECAEVRYWGADLIVSTLKDNIPKLNEDDALENELIKKAKPNIPDGEGVCNSANRTYMCWEKVTCKSSRSYKVLNSKYAWTNKKTGLRMYGDRYCIALGQGYALPGTKVDIVMKNGHILRCIVGDAKAILDTDESRRYQHEDGSILEMIMDCNYFKGSDQYPDEILGKIEKIVVLPKDF